MASLSEVFQNYKEQKPSIKNYPIRTHCPKCGKISLVTKTTKDGNRTQIYECGHQMNYGY